MKLNILWVAFGVFYSSFILAASSKIPSVNPFKVKLEEGVQASKPHVKLVFSGNIAGTRDTCGCAINPKGGLERRYNYLKKSPKGGLLLDFGNLLFKSSDIDSNLEGEARSNAQKLLTASEKFNYSAINLGLLDRSLGAQKMANLLSKNKIPWVSSNVSFAGAAAPVLQKSIKFKLENYEIGLLGLSSRDEISDSRGWNVEDPEAALNRELTSLGPTVFPIVLSDLEMSELMKIAKRVKRPVVFIGSRESGGWDRPIEIGHSLLLHLRQQGQEWGELSFVPTQNHSVGWYHSSDSEHLAQRWDSLVSEVKNIRSLASSSEKNNELATLESRIRELSELAPKVGDISYQFSTVEMGAAFIGKNEFTPLMK